MLLKNYSIKKDHWYRFSLSFSFSVKELQGLCFYCFNHFYKRLDDVTRITENILSKCSFESILSKDCRLFQQNCKSM